MQRTNSPGEVKPKQSRGKPIVKGTKPRKKKKTPKKDLAIRQQLFVKEYLVDFDSTRAAIAVGYSKDTASAIGCNLLTDPRIQRAIQKDIDRRMARVDVRQDMVINELAGLAFSDICQFVSWDADGIKLNPSDLLPGRASACLSEISEHTSKHGTSTKIKLYDKIRALELLGRHLGMFVDRLDVNAKVVKTDEQKFHIIQEIIAQPEVADRIRENFRSRFRSEPSPE